MQNVLETEVKLYEAMMLDATAAAPFVGTWRKATVGHWDTGITLVTVDEAVPKCEILEL
jgi:hypothetical protein